MKTVDPEIREKQREYQRQWWIKNRDLVREKRREYALANRERHNELNKLRYHRKKESEQARKREWFKKNPEKLAAIINRYREAHPEAARLACQKWRKNNLEADRARSATRRAMHRAAEGKFTFADIRSIKTLQRGRCGYCRKSLRDGFHVDHIIALAKGGSNKPSNLQLLCTHCNTSKGMSDPIRFAQRRGLLI